MKNKFLKKIMFIFTSLLLAFIAFRITYLFCNMTYEGQYISTDFYFHMNMSKEILRDGFTGILYHISYPLWHLGTYLAQKILHSGWDIAAAANTAALYIVMFATYVYVFRNKVRLSFWGAFCLSLYLIILEPISKTGILFQFSCRSQLIATWHNPTIIWPRILAIPIILLFIHIWESTSVSITNYLLFSFLLVTITLGKPAFVQVFFPAILIFCLLECLTQRFKPFVLSVKLAIACIPTLLLIIFQYAITFNEDGNGSVEIAWFKVMEATNKLSPIVLLGTLVFPLFYLVAYKKWNNMTHLLSLSWIMYGVSFLEYAALAEVGDRTYHSNFGWGYMISLIILHMSSILEFRNEKMSVKKKIGYLLLLMHLICGISWIAFEMTEKGVYYHIGYPLPF